MSTFTAPPQLPARTPCHGEDAGLWAIAILEELGCPRSKVNCYAIAGWIYREGGGGENNPMNTTLAGVGTVGEVNSVGVKDYATPADGVIDTAQTLHGYPSIVLSLRDDRGLTGPGVSAELHEWSGGGYSQITPVAVPLPPAPAQGIFTAALSLTERGAWAVHGTHNSSGVKLGGPDQIEWTRVGVNRSTGGWVLG